MALETQLNVVACGAGDVIGTGQQGCKFDWDRIYSLEFSPSSYTYTGVELSLSNIKQAQQKKEVVIVSGFESFKHVDAAPKISTSEGSGEKSVDGELPYEFEGTFKGKGYNFWKAMRRLNGSSYNVAFYDINGSKITTKTKSGIERGFKTSMIFTDKYSGKESEKAAEFKFMMQLSEASIKEIEAGVWVDGSRVDYSVDEIEGINDVLFTPSALATGATSLVVKATLLDKTNFVGGFVTADFLVKRAGVTVVHTAVLPNASAGTYTITIPAATAGTYTVETKNAFGTNVVLVVSNGLLFQSNIGTVIAV
jgi:hypothetical protein